MNQSDKLSDLYYNLKKFHLSDSLYVIGAINAAIKFGSNKPEYNNIPVWVANYLKKFGSTLQDRKALSVTLSRMARFLLLSSANDHKGDFIDFNRSAGVKAYNGVVNLEDIDDKSGSLSTLENFSLYFNRLGQIQLPLQRDRSDIVGRGFMLFYKTLNKIQSQYDFNTKFKEYYNLTLIEFLTAGFVMWMLTNGTLDDESLIEIPQLKKFVTSDTQKIFLSLSSGTQRQYREFLRGDNWKVSNKLKDMYALDPFSIMPAIKVEKSNIIPSMNYVVPQAKYLLDRASSGIFYLLSDKEREIGAKLRQNKRNPFRDSFGMVYRAYVGEHLAISGDHSFIDLDYDFESVQGKIPDFAIIHENICILFEVKTSLLNIDSRTYFEKETLEKEVKNGKIQGAISQLREFKSKILTDMITDDRFSSVDTVFGVVVGYEDIYCLNSTILPILEDLYGSTVDDLQFASISDIEALGSAIGQEQNIVELLKDKVQHSAKRQWAIGTLINQHTNYPNSLLVNSFNEFLETIGLKRF